MERYDYLRAIAVTSGNRDGVELSGEALTGNTLDGYYTGEAIQAREDRKKREGYEKRRNDRFVDTVDRNGLPENITFKLK